VEAFNPFGTFKVLQPVAFRIKVVLLILAALNVLYFHKRVMHNVDQWITICLGAQRWWAPFHWFYGWASDRGAMERIFLTEVGLLVMFAHTES